MPYYKKQNKTEIEQRRAIIAELLLKGFTKPAQILKNEGIQDKYQMYKNPIMMIKSDIKAIKQAYRYAGGEEDVPEIIGELLEELRMAKRNLWQVYHELETDDYNGKLDLITKILELDEKMAFYRGVDPNMAVPKTHDVRIAQATQISMGKEEIDKGVNNLREGLAEFGEYFGLDGVKQIETKKDNKSDK